MRGKVPTRDRYNDVPVTFRFFRPDRSRRMITKTQRDPGDNYQRRKRAVRGGKQAGKLRREERKRLVRQAAGTAERLAGRTAGREFAQALEIEDADAPRPLADQALFPEAAEQPAHRLLGQPQVFGEIVVREW